MLDSLDKIASILSGFGIFIGAVFVTLQFKYKHDAEVRKIYIENYKKTELIQRQVLREGTAAKVQFPVIWDILNEAELCLHKDIVKLVEKIKTNYIELFFLEKKESAYLLVTREI